MEEIFLIEIILQWFEDIGLVGLFAAMFLEGLSIPFPGVAVVLAYGYILPFSYWDTAWIAIGMSLVYCMASIVPYYLGSKLEGLFIKRPNKGLQRAKDLFVRYGGWSVAISRPFGLGNYISYVAGMSKMRLTPYLILTFIGIYPWSFVMICLGNYFNGSFEAFSTFYKNNSVYLYISLVILLGFIFLYFFIKNKRKNSRTIVKEGGDDRA
jgi:membrane protein DedA with SNARE-associated domain